MLAAPYRLHVGEPVRVVPAATAPVSLAEIRAHCRLTDDDGTDEDALLMGYLRSATEHVEDYSGLALITQTWEQTVSGFPTSLEWHPRYLPLSRRPLQEVESITYLDVGGVPQLLSSGAYVVRGLGTPLYTGSVSLAVGGAWPSTLVDAEAVRIRYVAGFGDGHNDVPEVIRHAIMMLTAYWFNQREAALIDPEILEVPFGIEALLARWRPFGVA